MASVNRNVSTDRDTSSALKQNFNESEIKADFAIASTLIRETGTFLSNRMQEADDKRNAATQLEKKAADPNANLTDEQRQQMWEQAQQARADAIDTEKKWGAGGTYRQVANALMAAVGGNVTAGTGQFLQNAVVNYIQQQGAQYIGTLVADGVVKEGSPEHAALHSVVACAGAAASSQSCGAGALGAAAASLLTNLFNDDPNESNVNKDAKRNLVTSLVAGVAALVSPNNAATATESATASTDNNWLTPKQRVDRDQRLADCKTDACRKQVKDDFAKLWQSNHDRAETCSTVQACLAVVDELRGVQRQSSERSGELQAKLKATGSLSTDEMAEFYALQRGGESIQGMSSLALSRAVRLGGPSVLQSEQASKVIGDVLISAAPMVGAVGSHGVSGQNASAQQRRVNELTELFDKANPASEISLGGKQYTATADSNRAGTTKVFDTRGLPDAQLERQARTFVDELTGGAQLSPKGNPPSVWTTTLSDGTTVNLRSTSNSTVGSTGAQPRWTVDVINNPSVQAVSPRPRIEIKFQ